jgi:hypothetical protein
LGHLYFSPKVMSMQDSRRRRRLLI